MASYDVNEAVHGETNDTLLGRVPFDFKKGAVKPKSEAEEFALLQLVDQGLATRKDDPGVKLQPALSEMEWVQNYITDLNEDAVDPSKPVPSVVVDAENEETK